MEFQPKPPRIVFNGQEDTTQIQKDVQLLVNRIGKTISSRLTDEDKELFDSISTELDNIAGTIGDSIDMAVTPKPAEEKPEEAPEEKPAEEKPEEKPEEEKPEEEAPKEEPETKKEHLERRIKNIVREILRKSVTKR